LSADSGVAAFSGLAVFSGAAFSAFDGALAAAAFSGFASVVFLDSVAGFASALVFAGGAVFDLSMPPWPLQAPEPPLEVVPSLHVTVSWA
jgi:hypothetical protein